MLKLKYSRFNTILGEMLAVTSEHHLYLLEFTDYKYLDRAIKHLKNSTESEIEESESELLILVEKQINQYLKKEIKSFTVPIMFTGTEFQQQVWQALQKIPYGSTINYKELAESVGKLHAFRAAANSNGANKLVIIVPCHRVIASNGGLGGYSCGLERKKRLLELESC